MGCPMDLEQWKSTFFGLDRSRRRELDEIRDSCRRNLVGCVILRSEGTVKGTLILWIHSCISGVTCCWYLDQQVYGWVECPSQKVGCTNSLLKISVYLFCWVIYEFMAVIYSMNENDCICCYRCINSIHVCLECCSWI